MSDSIITIIKKIKDSSLAKLITTGTDGEPIYLDCIYKESESPNFFLVFPPDTLPGDIERSKCKVSINVGDDPVIITASIEEFPNDRTIELKGKESIDPRSLREYFRVFYRTVVTASHEPTSDDPKAKSWSMQGDSVDLSGTGILVIFPEEPQNRKNIFLDFDLPDVSKSIHCVGHVVRTKRIRKGRFQVALHFDHITRKNRDAIITACLHEQRRQLRERMEGDN